MNAPLPVSPPCRSPLHAWFQAHALERSEIEDAPLQFEDLSWRPRFGCKGPGAEPWLAAGGYRVPTAANSAVLGSNGVLVARLASSEFLIEAVDAGFERVANTRARLHQRSHPSVVYPVARQDLAIAIGGAGLNALLRQTCSVDFAPLLAAAAREGGPVVLTSMIGIGVLAWPRPTDTGPALTLWCDPSFAHYFWSTLLAVGRDSGDVTIHPSVAGSST
jgi:sarcosine oxidase subunit gamma